MDEGKGERFRPSGREADAQWDTVMLVAGVTTEATFDGRRLRLRSMSSLGSCAWLDLVAQGPAAVPFIDALEVGDTFDVTVRLHAVGVDHFSAHAKAMAQTGHERVMREAEGIIRNACAEGRHQFIPITAGREMELVVGIEKGRRKAEWCRGCGSLKVDGVNQWPVAPTIGMLDVLGELASAVRSVEARLRKAVDDRLSGFTLAELTDVMQVAARVGDDLANMAHPAQGEGSP